MLGSDTAPADHQLHAHALYPGTPYEKLTKDQIDHILASESAQYVWRNDHSLRAVFSAQCTCEVCVPTSLLEKLGYGAILPCAYCLGLIKNRTFTNALRRRMPDEENFKYTPLDYRGGEMGKIFLKFHGVSW